jgi:hypothetical protein
VRPNPFFVTFNTYFFTVEKEWPKKFRPQFVTFKKVTKENNRPILSPWWRPKVIKPSVGQKTTIYFLYFWHFFPSNKDNNNANSATKNSTAMSKNLTYTLARFEPTIICSVGGDDDPYLHQLSFFCLS